MKSNKLLLGLAFPILIGSMLLTSCGTAAGNDGTVSPSDKVIINILHQEDYMDNAYMSIEDVEADYGGEDLSQQEKEKMLAVIKKFEKRYPECHVVFNTSETNETVYSELKTGKAEYNLVTVSEYMIQRMASENLIHNIRKVNEDLAKQKGISADEMLPAYTTNISSWIKEQIDNITIKSYENPDEILGKLSDYTVGYMWGTLGIVVNPNFYRFQQRGMKPMDVVEELGSLNGWHAFWDPRYKTIASVKDSIRDTYAMGIFEEFKSEYENPDVSHEAKQARFNDHSRETINAVKDTLINLKKNIYGFEVDQGKNDILTGEKIGMNLAWSGDAWYSIYQGNFDSNDNRRPENDKNNVDLYYKIPKLGSNIWFDGFAIPASTKATSKEYEYTLKFLDFMCEPEIVVQNMSYIGFTSFCSGPATGENLIRDYIIDTYDMDPATPNLISYDVSYFFNGGDMVLHVDPNSFEGRALVAQYPEEKDIDHLYIMEDYGADNGKMVQMWEDVKVNPLPTWSIVLLITFVVGVLAYLASYKLIKKYKVKKRKALRK